MKKIFISEASVRAAITLDWIFFVNVLFDNHAAMLSYRF
ncbi:hypothetical protein ACS0PU_001501 [Formica fusca]